MSQLKKTTTPTPKQRIHKRKFPKGKPRLVDINEASYRTGYAISTIWAKVAADEFIQPIRVKAGVTRFLESDLDKWIDDLVESHRKSA